MNNNQLTGTPDMGLAVALSCRGYELVDLEPSGGARYVFRFRAAQGVDEAAMDYWNGRLLVDAKQFWAEAKNLKARLYSLR